MLRAFFEKTLMLIANQIPVCSARREAAHSPKQNPPPRLTLRPVESLRKGAACAIRRGPDPDSPSVRRTVQLRLPRALDWASYMRSSATR
jgi:hypothetical protein